MTGVALPLNDALSRLGYEPLGGMANRVFLNRERAEILSLRAGVTQHARIDYRISAAVFDRAGRLLGAAAHTEAVQYIRLGRTPMLLKSIDLDFGVSRAYREAGCVAVAISDPEVPSAPQCQAHPASVNLPRRRGAAGRTGAAPREHEEQSRLRGRGARFCGELAIARRR